MQRPWAKRARRASSPKLWRDLIALRPFVACNRSTRCLKIAVGVLRRAGRCSMRFELAASALFATLGLLASNVPALAADPATDSKGATPICANCPEDRH